MPKQRGGFGIKNIETFHVDLVGKWKWMMLVEQNSLSVRVFKSKYKSISQGKNEGNVKFGSILWHDIQKVMWETMRGGPQITSKEWLKRTKILVFGRKHEWEGHP